MSYTPATQLPNLAIFQWAQVNAPSPRLAQAISKTDTVLVFSDPPLDKTGAVISLGFLMGIATGLGYTETIYVPAGALSVDGLTATGVVRGIRLDGIDFTTGDPTLASDFNVDSAIYCNVSAVNWLLLIAAMKGGIGSGGNVWQIGTATDVDIIVYAFNGDVNKPFWKYDSVTDQWIFSNDGVSSSPFGTGAGISAGGGIILSAGVVSVNLADTTKFVSTSAGAADSGKVPRLNGSGQLDASFINSTATVFTVTAGENITQGYAVYIKISDGKAYKCDASSVGEAVENFAGFAATTVTTGNSVVITMPSYVNLFSGLTVGSPYYLTNTPGVIGTTAGTVRKRVGVAVSTTALAASFEPSSVFATYGFTATTSETVDTVITLGFNANLVLASITDGSSNANGGIGFALNGHQASSLHGLRNRDINAGVTVHGADFVNSIASLDTVVQQAASPVGYTIDLSILSSTATTITIRRTITQTGSPGSLSYTVDLYTLA